MDGMKIIRHLHWHQAAAGHRYKGVFSDQEENELKMCFFTRFIKFV